MLPGSPRTRALSSALGLALCALAAACSSTGDGDSDLLGEDMASLSTLPAADVMRVQVVEHGQWGDSGYELEFRRGAQPAVSGIRLTGTWSESASRFEVRARSPRRRGAITPRDLLDLDTILEYYRSDPDDSCDDTRIVTLTQLRKGKTIATEQLVDRSCGEGLDVRTTFADVFARLKAEG